MTLNDAQQTTSAQVNALIARIDPALIERIDKARSASSGCRGNDVDPEQHDDRITGRDAPDERGCFRTSAGVTVSGST